MKPCANDKCDAQLPDDAPARYCTPRCQHVVAHRTWNARHKVLVWRVPEGVRLPEWDKAACLGTAEKETAWPFFEEELSSGRPDNETVARNEEATQLAKEVCARCPIREGCLAWALATREPFGVWGGLDPAERRSAVRRLRQQKQKLAVSA